MSQIATEQDWIKSVTPRDLLVHVHGTNSIRRMRLFSLACCRQVWHLLTHPISQLAVEIAKRFADGKATNEELALNGDPRYGAMRVSDLGPRLFEERWAQWIRDIFGKPAHVGSPDPRWLTATVRDLAQTIYDEFPHLAPGLPGEANAKLHVLADALMDAGCDCEEIIKHCQGPGPHVRGCWAIDLLLAKS